MQQDIGIQCHTPAARPGPNLFTAFTAFAAFTTFAALTVFTALMAAVFLAVFAVLVVLVVVAAFTALAGTSRVELLRLTASDFGAFSLDGFAAAFREAAVA